MPWSGGTFTRTDGTRNGADVWKDAKAAAVKIIAADHDTHDQDIGTALNNTLTKDGQNTATGNLPMGGFIHTGVGNATARNHYAAAGQAQDSTMQWGGTASGTVDVITFSVTPAITAYAAGQTFRFISSGANTGAVTVNINAVGAVAVTKRGGTALIADDIPSGATITLTYDGTNMELVSTQPLITAVGAAILDDGTAASQRTTLGFSGAAGTVATANIEDLAVTKAKIADGTQGGLPIYGVAGQFVELAAGTDGYVLRTNGAGANQTWQQSSIIVQEQRTAITAVATSSSTIPHDDTIPQITEGFEITTVAITPTNSAHKLMIEAEVMLGTSNGGSGSVFTLGLFQDATAAALAAMGTSAPAGNEGTPCRLTYEMTAGTSSATTLRLRGGLNNAGVTTVNGEAGVRRYGGIAASYIKVTEKTS